MPWPPVAQSFEALRSPAHGHVQAVALTLQRLGLASVVASKPCRERDLVLAMVAARILSPHTKLATTRWWHTTTLAEDFGVVDADEDDLYAAMDWLLARQDRDPEEARRSPSGPGCHGAVRPVLELLRGHLLPAGQARLQPRWQVAACCRSTTACSPMRAAAQWRSRCTRATSSDSKTLMPAVHQLREDFGIEQLVMVGDRGMISNKAIDELRETDGVGWITALKSVSIRALVEQGHLQLGLFDERNLVELSSPDYPGERLVACRNPELAKLRAHKREELLAATETNLDKIKLRVACGQARRQRQDRRARGQDHQPVQGGQALRADHRGQHVHLRAQARGHRRRSGAGRHLHHPHLGP